MLFRNPSLDSKSDVPEINTKYEMQLGISPSCLVITKTILFISSLKPYFSNTRFLQEI